MRCLADICPTYILLWFSPPTFNSFLFFQADSRVARVSPPPQYEKCFIQRYLEGENNRENYAPFELRYPFTTESPPTPCRLNLKVTNIKEFHMILLKMKVLFILTLNVLIATIFASSVCVFSRLNPHKSPAN